VQPPAVCRPSRPVPGAGSLSEHDMRRAVACARVRVGAHMTRLLLDCQNHVHQGAAQRPAYAGEPAVHHQRRGGHRQDARDAGVERVCRRAQPGRHDLRPRTPVLTRALLDAFDHLYPTCCSCRFNVCRRAGRQRSSQSRVWEHGARHAGASRPALQALRWAPRSWERAAGTPTWAYIAMLLA